MCLSMSLAAGSTHRLILVFSLDGIFFSGCFPSFVEVFVFLICDVVISFVGMWVVVVIFLSFGGACVCSET